MLQKSYTESLLTTLLAFVPLIVYWCLKEFVEPRPFWAFYDHIESLYFYTAVELLEGITPHNIDNPGSTVQAVGALLLGLVGTEPDHYPIFVHVARLAVLVLSFLATVVLLRQSLGGVGRVASVVAVWVYFCFSVALVYFHVWSPEAFFYILGALAIASLFYLLNDPQDLPAFRIALFGASIGLLIATKFIFLAWLPGLCLMLFVSGLGRSFITAIKQPLIGLAGVVAGFLVATFPVRDGYPYMFSWVLQNAARDGDYGRGQVALPSLSGAVENWLSFALSSKLWIFVIALMVLALVASRSSTSQPSKAECDRLKLVLWFVIPSIVFSLLFVIRAYNQRYLLPIGLCGVMVAIMYLRVVAVRSALLNVLTPVVLGLLLFKTMGNDFNTHQVKIAQQQALKDSIEQKLAVLAASHQIDDPVVVLGWRIPSPAFALRQHARYEVHQQRVDELYPRTGHYTPWPVGKQMFRIPSTAGHWDFAVIRNDNMAILDIGEYQVAGSIDRYQILRPAGK